MVPMDSLQYLIYCPQIPIQYELLPLLTHHVSPEHPFKLKSAVYYSHVHPRNIYELQQDHLLYHIKGIVRTVSNKYWKWHPWTYWVVISMYPASSTRLCYERRRDVSWEARRLNNCFLPTPYPCSTRSLCFLFVQCCSFLDSGLLFFVVLLYQCLLTVT